MKPLILIVEDNVDLLYNLILVLESNNYSAISAKNGKIALQLLSELQQLPDIIISDIMMPEMDGYEFFRAVSEEPQWNRIPFIFLSARTTPEEIRFGKLLGIDDYLTKPFNEKDLLAVISGKISRINRIKALDKKIGETLSNLNIEVEVKTVNGQKNSFMWLLLTYWDDKIGPKLDSYYPKKKDLPISLDSIVNQLFTAVTSIYGYDKITKAEGVLLNIKNLNSQGYLYFDSFPDKNERFKEKQYMIAIIAPIISYFHSLNIKDLFVDLSNKIKHKIKWNIEDYWKKIYEILVEDTPQNFIKNS